MADMGNTAAPSPTAHSSMEAVEVPDGIAPGASFKVLLPKKRSGRNVLMEHTLWKPSGPAPLLQRGVMTLAQGPRHALRPHAVAKQAKGRNAKAVDNFVTAPANVSAWQSAEQLPFEVDEEDVGWLPGPVNGNGGRLMPAFTGASMGIREPGLSSRSSARGVGGITWRRKAGEVVACGSHGWTSVADGNKFFVASYIRG